MILLPALVGLAGLAYDGGMLFAGRREANNLAAASARAGTNDLYQPSIYAGDPVMAPTAAASAQAFGLSHGADTITPVKVNPTLMDVTVTMNVDVLFLGIFGIGSQTVTGHASSRVTPGVSQ